MKASAFDYVRPPDLAGVLDMLRQFSGAKLIAGGQSLLPLLNLRLARPTLLIDIGRTEALRAIEDRGTHVRIGAAVTHAELEDCLIPDCPMLRTVAGGIAYRAIRNRGTVGGSLAHADPAADWPLAMAALGATVVVEGKAGHRRLPADGFMLGAFQTRLEEDELVVAVDVPKLSPDARYGYYKFCRKTGEFPEASAAAVFDPFSRTARLYLGALSGPPQPLHDLAATIARQGLAAIADVAIADAVDRVAAGDSIERRMRCAAVTRALKEVFAE
ncbi:xanthine dehydrogenase family protein subunit M [Bradyrhizobium sp. URHD0069]|uniref:FAD binding domain-containing protein n=1 Tax=Bradyrhizobium sp. URHD0069 TaxID=1380355 RepID=UPI0004965AE5|nr:FAD binding domain-containing protein [Bradyrhizobium sp. URHD0069]